MFKLLINNYIIKTILMSGFYHEACEIDGRATPFAQDLTGIQIAKGETKSGSGTNDLWFLSGTNAKAYTPHSIMNDNVAINYRSIQNGYPTFDNNTSFTEYNDYLRCTTKETQYLDYLDKKRNPTYQNILAYYNTIDESSGLSSYKVQDFIYLKYFNQIPNNYMLTLRRYMLPCEDHMFGLDMISKQIKNMNGYDDAYSAVATAVTYMGEQTGNKLSDILKFDYGANWEEKTAQIQSIQSADGGLAAQLKEKLGVSSEHLEGKDPNIISGKGIKNTFITSVMLMGKGKTTNEAAADQYVPDGNLFQETYGNEFWGDLNVVQQVKMRSRGLTFSNNFSLTFEYSLKSLKCVNPRIAMMDILCNFLILTGNYGSFWGGATMFFGNKNIAPQYGQPSYLRQGEYGKYIQSLWDDVKKGFHKLGNDENGNKSDGLLDGILNFGKNLINNGINSLLGNIFGGNLGVAGESRVPMALLSGKPSGYWHLTVGNPLDPIAMMGNLAVTKTTVQFNDVLGYDDFPTEIKFTVDLEHCMPRDNANIENMFNAGKGRFYTFTNSGFEQRFHDIDFNKNFKVDNSTQEANYNGDTSARETHNGLDSNGIPYERMKLIGGMLNI